MPFLYVDAHTHFWDPAVLPYPWLSAHAAIASAHRPSTLRAELGEALPSALVFVQAECERARGADEVAWVEHLALTEPLIAAIVAFAPMDRGESTVAVLDAFAKRPLVRGIRHNIQDDPDPDLCRRLPFIAGVRNAGQRSFCFDLCVREGQLPAAIDLVRACPDTRFVLDHAGKPNIAAGRPDAWREHIRRLAEFPHVVCKLSGLATEAAPASPLADELRPYVEHLLAYFGPDRLLFGSDWPVVKLASSAMQWLETAQSLLSHLTPKARGAIFSDNARRTYRLS